MFRTRAPAKINLTLHVLGRRQDGYHELESLVAFAGVADSLTLTPGQRPELDVEGPTAAAAGAPGENLVLRAAKALSDRVSGLTLGRFRLSKRLPVGAGIGGGSSDAAAALRLLAQANGLASNDSRLLEAARETGADVPVCLHPRTRVMRGTGDVLGPVLPRPPFLIVLANPGLHLETRAVFARMGLEPGATGAAGRHSTTAPTRGDREAWLAALRRGRNDMESAAIALAPAIEAVLRRLAETPGCRLARMSGSGSTCFGLFDTRQEASAGAARIRALEPGWWVRASVLR